MNGKTSLIIVPDEGLWELPFQALIAGDHYLLESSAVSYSPSLTVLRELRAEREKRWEKKQSDPNAKTLLAVGNPTIGKETIDHMTLSLRDEKLTPLPEAEEEVKALGRLYGTNRSSIYTGLQASEARVKLDAGQAGILHFATHGTLN